MTEIVAAFLGIALILYCVLGGADYGAGILELFGGKKFRSQHQGLINAAMGPVWEANHVWLILAIVVLFTAFPPIFRQLSISYHIPITLLLLGITIRGCAFTFRHYDAVKDQSQKIYTGLFVVSSLITPLFLGMIAGSMPAGLIATDPAAGWMATYIHPWCNGFAFSVGVFTVCLFAYIAGIYLAGEAQGENRADFIRLAKGFGTGSIISGALVFVMAYVYGIAVFSQFASNAIFFICVAVASFAFYPITLFLKADRIWAARIFVAAQVTAVMVGWFAVHYPAVLSGGDVHLTIYNSAAPPATMQSLLIALAVGSILIFPSLGYLLYVFKSADAAQR